MCAEVLLALLPTDESKDSCIYSQPRSQNPLPFLDKKGEKRIWSLGTRLLYSKLWRAGDSLKARVFALKLRLLRLVRSWSTWLEK